MNITFFIGNGFDLNLGLATSYMDFFNQYKEPSQEDSKEVLELKSSINQYIDNNRGSKNPDIIDWSQAELAFGHFTPNFSDRDNGDQLFSNCHLDFCNELITHLAKEEERFNIDALKKDRDLMQAIWSGFLDVARGLRPRDQDIIRNLVNSQGGGFSLNIIDFNYTTIIDKIADALKQAGVPGRRIFHNSYYNNGINPILHIHGTTTHGMTLGVNDESQLEDDIFSDNEPERRWQIIKPIFNENMGEGIEEKACKALNTAQIIYIYGMSMGDTDKRWWERIVNHLKDNKQAILVIHQYGFPMITRYPMEFAREQRIFKDRFLAFGDAVEGDQTERIKERIFLTGANIFECLTDYVSKEDKNNA